MFERIAVLFVDALSLYVLLGVVFAVAFACVGVKRIDSQAVGTGVGFRILIFQLGPCQAAGGTPRLCMYSCTNPAT